MILQDMIGSQNSKEIGKGLLKNKEVSKQFGRLLKATNDYATGTISKRGMTGVFNLYGKKFIETASRALPSTVAKLTAKNLGKLGATTILSTIIGIHF